MASIFKSRIQIVAITGENFLELRVGNDTVPFMPLHEVRSEFFDYVIIWSDENFFDILSTLKANIPDFSEEQVITINSLFDPTFMIDKQRNFPYRIMKDALTNIIFKNEPRELEVKIKNIQEYVDIVASHPQIVSYPSIVHSMYSKLPGKIGYYPGYCAACQREQFFLITYDLMGVDGYPAWTETAQCTQCWCNSRMRHIVHRVLNSGTPFNEKIYINERIASVYHAMSKFYPNLVGSEYLGKDKIGGEFYNGIRHEDAMNLSFDDETFAAVVSCDVFEHVADCRKGFRETLRVLKTGGKFIFTVPIFTDKLKTLVRASINDSGELVHHEPPVYHGNPVDPQGGSLAFYDYGWDILEILKECGFKDANFVIYFSAERAHFGKPFSFSIEAVK